jgi:serine/threonine protein kinase
VKPTPSQPVMNAVQQLPLLNPVQSQPPQPVTKEIVTPRNTEILVEPPTPEPTTPNSASTPGSSTTPGSGSGSGRPSGQSKGGRINRWDKYKKEKQLSKGGQGTVYKARDTLTDKEIAIKRIIINDVNEANYAFTEAYSIKNVKHENIVEYKDVFMENVGDGTWGICLVMEYYAKGDLGLYLKRRADKKSHSPPDKVLSYLLQLASALDFLHGQKIMHRDIKPRKCILTRL